MAKRKKKQKTHSEEFKREAVRLFATRGNSTGADIAESLGISVPLLYRWRKLYGENQPRAASALDLEAQLAKQRRDIAQLRKENLTLKKSIALFVREMDL